MPTNAEGSKAGGPAPQEGTSSYATAPYGGAGWRPRTAALEEELGTLWRACGNRSEWGRLEAVLLHEPGAELGTVEDPAASLMLELPDPEEARREHLALQTLYRDAGVEVHLVDPGARTFPNLLFVADLFFMTPEGAVLARPAGAVRAGEERWVQRRLAELGVPILRAVSGTGTFEGADAMWLDEDSVLLARGLRTNAEGARQVAGVLHEMGVEVLLVDLPPGTMHLMGQLRIVDRDLAFAREGRLEAAALDALDERGYRVRFFPDDDEMDRGQGHNTVTLGPRELVMPDGCPRTRALYEEEGVRCHVLPLREIPRAAGGIGCMTGVLRRG